MNPIPLHHSRTVYAWACGRCHTLADKAADRMGYDPKDRRPDIAHWAGYSRSRAERCCLCHECEAPLPEGQRSGSCGACEAKRVALRQEADAAARRLDVMIVEARGGLSGEAALQLREAMECYARDYYDAFDGDDGVWPEAMAFDLWDDANNGSTHPMTVALVTLAREAGGWWAWSDEAGDAVFVPADEWAQRVAGRAG